VKPITDYLASLPYKPKPNCQQGHYYMLNNMSPGFLPNGTIDTANIASGAKVPPSALRTIGDALNDAKISWAYHGGGYYDHVSILKFIERNWKLNLLTGRSRDNLPNPTASANPYVPGARPPSAIYSTCSILVRISGNEGGGRIIGGRLLQNANTPPSMG